MEELINTFNQLNIAGKIIVKDIMDNTNSKNDIEFIIESLQNIKLDNLNSLNSEEDNKKIDLAIKLIKNYYNILSSKKRCVYFNDIKTPYFIY